MWTLLCVLQARRNIISILSQLLDERRASQETHEDMLGCLMGGRGENRYKLTDEEIIDLIITIMYSGYETVSTTSMMAVKYLHDHPKVLEEIRVSERISSFIRHLVIVFLFCPQCDILICLFIYFTERAFCHKRKEKA